MASTPALAQGTAPAAPGGPASSPPASHVVEGITVIGEPPAVRSSIDRRSYTLGKDLRATTGSIGDALRNVPSVEVDAQGNLTLRGDPNVTILVDGKPAPQFEGAGRAEALQQLEADQFERVEVITNPSASLTPEGSGGVVNLVRKTARGRGLTGSTYLTAGSMGLKRAGGRFGYNSKNLTVSGSLSGNYQRGKYDSRDERAARGPPGPALQDNVADLVGKALSRGPSAQLTFDYSIDPKTSVSGSVDYNQFLATGPLQNRIEVDAPDGTPLGLLDRYGSRRLLLPSSSLTFGWRRKLSPDGAKLSIDLIENDARQRERVLWSNLQSLPLAGATSEANRNDADLRHSELRIAYDRPLADGASLKLGYELKHDENSYAHLEARGARASDLVVDALVTNQFDYRRTTNAAYGTYERAFGDVSAQFGLRLEDFQTSLHQLTTGEQFDTDELRAYPTVHLSYDLEEGRKVTASYSERVQRAPPFLLNPVRFRLDPSTFQQGNPGLKSLVTQSLELGYEQKQGQSFASATVYFRRNNGEFTPVLRDLGEGVFLNTFETLGDSRTAGLEFVFNGSLGSRLTYNASSNLYWSEIDPGSLVVGGKRSGFGVSGRANLNWQLTSNDIVQLNVLATGKRFTAQGFNEPVQTLNLGWRHKLNDRLTLTATAQDLLASDGFGRRYETPLLSERFDFRRRSQSVAFRLDYRFGSRGERSARDPGFVYDAGTPPM